MTIFKFIPFSFKEVYKKDKKKFCSLYLSETRGGRPVKSKLPLSICLASISRLIHLARHVDYLSTQRSIARVCTRACVHTCVYPCVCIRAFVRVCMCMRAYVRAYLCITAAACARIYYDRSFLYAFPGIRLLFIYLSHSSAPFFANSRTHIYSLPYENSIAYTTRARIALARAIFLITASCVSIYQLYGVGVNSV